MAKDFFISNCHVSGFVVYSRREDSFLHKRYRSTERRRFETGGGEKGKWSLKFVGIDRHGVCRYVREKCHDENVAGFCRSRFKVSLHPKRGHQFNTNVSGAIGSFGRIVIYTHPNKYSVVLHRSAV